MINVSHLPLGSVPFCTFLSAHQGVTQNSHFELLKVKLRFEPILRDGDHMAYTYTYSKPTTIASTAS